MTILLLVQGKRWCVRLLLPRLSLLGLSLLGLSLLDLSLLDLSLLLLRFMSRQRSILSTVSEQVADNGFVHLLFSTSSIVELPLCQSRDNTLVQCDPFADYRTPDLIRTMIWIGSLGFLEELFSEPRLQRVVPCSYPGNRDIQAHLCWS